MMPNRKAPCKGCQDRYPGCSDRCEKEEFLDWKEEQRVIREARKRESESIVIAYESVSRERCQKYSRRRSRFGFSYNKKNGGVR